MERSVSVPSDQNIRNITSGGRPLISVGLIEPKFAVPFLTYWFTSLRLFTYVENSEKEQNIYSKSHSSCWPSLILKCGFIFLGYSHCSLTGRVCDTYVLNTEACREYFFAWRSAGPMNSPASNDPVHRLILDSPIHFLKASYPASYCNCI